MFINKFTGKEYTFEDLKHDMELMESALQDFAQAAEALHSEDFDEKLN